MSTRLQHGTPRHWAEQPTQAFAFTEDVPWPRPEGITRVGATGDGRPPAMTAPDGAYGPPPVAPDGGAQRPMWRRARVLAPVAFVLGIVVGSAGGDDPAQGQPFAAVPAQTVTETVTASASGQDLADEPVDEPTASRATRTATRTATSTKATRTSTRTSRPRRTTASVEPVSYANCTEAREAGAAPILRGEPGYAGRLDRDDDGIACEV